MEIQYTVSKFSAEKAINFDYSWGPFKTLEEAKIELSTHPRDFKIYRIMIEEMTWLDK